MQFSPSGVGMEFEFSYAAVMLLGLTLLLPLLVHWAARAIRPAMDRVGGSEGALAVDAMIQSPRRSAATVGALMVGLMFVYLTGAYIQSYKHMIHRWTNQMLNADLVVSTSSCCGRRRTISARTWAAHRDVAEKVRMWRTYGSPGPVSRRYGGGEC